MPLRTRSQSSRSPPPPNSSQPHHDDEDDDSSSNKENVQKRADFAPPKQYKKPWSRTPMLETQQQQQPPPDPAKPSPYQVRSSGHFFYRAMADSIVVLPTRRWKQSRLGRHTHKRRRMLLDTHYQELSCKDCGCSLSVGLNRLLGSM